MPIEGHNLKSRYCPDHSGTSTFKLAGSDHIYVCPLDHKQYDYLNGYTLMNGDKVPGGSVEAQTDSGANRFFSPMFDNREGRLSTNK